MSERLSEGTCDQAGPGKQCKRAVGHEPPCFFVFTEAWVCDCDEAVAYRSMALTKAECGHLAWLCGFVEVAAPHAVGALAVIAKLTAAAKEGGE